MNNIILYRNYTDWKFESEAANKYFTCTDSRLNIKKNDLVIGRYSVLPFYKELENDIISIGAKLINTYNQHNYIADLKEWYFDLQDHTPKTWFRLVDLPKDGPFVLKGKTNSRKNYWKTHMFAENKKEAIEVHGRLMADPLIAEQDIVIRQYVPLHTYMIGIQNLPITKEFRFFVMYGQIVSGGFYWSNYIDDIREIEDPDISEVPADFLSKIINIIGDKNNFYVIDVAQTKEGNWIVIELNSGMMSGLSENDPEILYKNMQRVLNER